MRIRTLRDICGRTRQVGELHQWLTGFAETPRSETHRGLALLTGPPGQGKTTLAHLALRKFGYAPVEMNSSDERSYKLVMTRLVNTCQTTRVGVAPAALVMDELDGSDELGGVRAVQEFLERYPSANPIIATCNDPYKLNIHRHIFPHCVRIKFHVLQRQSVLIRLCHDMVARLLRLRSDDGPLHPPGFEQRCQSLLAQPGRVAQFVHQCGGDVRQMMNELHWQLTCENDDYVHQISATIVPEPFNLLQNLQCYSRRVLENPAPNH